MPRKPRKKSSTGTYHVILRGVNQQIIFNEKKDKTKILYTIKKYKDELKFELYGYCLMDNHVHLLIRETEVSISEVMKRICSSYVRWYNEKYNRCGHLFQERFKSETVENSISFLRVLRYIHQNPLKAGLVKDVFDSKWTSIHEYIRKAKMVDVDVALELFSAQHKKARSLFIEYMKETNDDEFMDVVAKVKISDQELILYLKQIGITNNTKLQQMEIRQRNELLADLKTLDGVTIRQLSRITGISKSVIQRARK